jgi:hypothetical protein
MRAVHVLVLAFITALLLATPAYALSSFTVSGNVTDANGIPLPHAYVMLNGPPIVDFQNEIEEKDISGAITDANGHFVCEVNKTQESQFSVTVDFISPAKQRDHFLETALYNVTGQDIVIPDSDIRFTDYILPETGYVHGLIVRESDRMLMTGTAYLSNGNISVVTNPLEFYVLEAAPGNYTVYAECYDENGTRLASDLVEVQVLPMENLYDMRPLDLLVRPASSANPGPMDTTIQEPVNNTYPGLSESTNPGALALALGLGLACILTLHCALRRL